MKIRPTRHCLSFFFILGAMFLASINYQSNAAWLMVFVIFTTGCMSAVHGWRNLSPAVITPGDSPLVQAGDGARLTLTVADPAARDLHALVIELPADLPADQADEDRPLAAEHRHRLLIPHVAGRGSARAELLLPPLARGVHQFTALHVSTQYPLGLWRALRRVPILFFVTVYPEPRGVPLAQAQPDADAATGSGARGVQHEHEDFRGLRPWQPSDSPRHIDWKAAARGQGPLLIKEWSGGGQGVTWLTWKATAGDPEARLSQLAKWVIEAHHLGLCYGLRLPGSELEPSSGGAHHLECLRALAACRLESRSSVLRPAVNAGSASYRNQKNAPTRKPGDASGTGSAVRPGSTASISGAYRILPSSPPNASQLKPPSGSSA